MLCQTLNAEFSPKGLHVAHILVDGAVDAPDTLGKMLGAQAFQKLREARGLESDGLLLPAEMAETYFHVAHQHRSAWTPTKPGRAGKRSGYRNPKATSRSSRASEFSSVWPDPGSFGNSANSFPVHFLPV